MSTYAYARTAPGRYLGSLMSDGEQRASVPVVLDDSNNVHANNVIDDIESESRPHTAESAPVIHSKSPPVMSDKPSVNPAQNIDAGDATPAHSQSHDPAASPQGQRGPVKAPLRHPPTPLATSHTASHIQETTTTTTTTTDIPSLTVVGSTPVTPTAPESFSRPPPQDDRLPLTGRSSPLNDRDRRQSRRRSVMDVSFPTGLSI
jgi:hypothetical protein